jgi:alkaline phosphatase D
MRGCLIVSLVIMFLTSAAWAGTLVSGPMLGYQTHREVLIWVETRGAESVGIRFYPEGQAESGRLIVVEEPASTLAGVQPIRFVLPLLEPGTTYQYEVEIDGERVIFAEPLSFKTTRQFEWRGHPPDFSFLFGSCAYFNDPPYDRPGRAYGGDTGIFRAMAASGADFMIWGGDNTYLREADFSSPSGIWYRYSKDRSHPDLQPLLRAMPHYATWDDHDFGPNNSNRAYTLKDVSLAAFNAYWGNLTAGEANNPGIYHRFQWGDAIFLVLDNRYHRDESELDGDKYPKSQYGDRQLAWLKQQLVGFREGGAARHTPIRFIVTGGQFLSNNDYRGAEGHVRYQAEREEILRFIREHRIPGVIFLTGDVHYTELQRHPDILPYPVYELTSSPLTSGAHSRALSSASTRVDGTVVQDRNYCQISLSGPPANRLITFRSFDPEGRELWSHSVAAADLRWPDP